MARVGREFLTAGTFGTFTQNGAAVRMHLVNSFLNVGLWSGYLTRALQALTLAVPVALLFEGGGWVVRRYVLRALGPAFARDQDRDPVARARRRRALRDLTVMLLRWAQNVLAIAVILTLWRVEPMAVALGLLLGVILAGALLKDLIAGYGLLLDDCLAPGDQVEIGAAAGTVVEVGARRVKLDVGQGVFWSVPCAEIRALRVMHRVVRQAEDG